MAKSWIKFEVSADVAAKTYEALKQVRQSGGSIRKGANEVTKSVEKGIATFVVIATDVEPEEVVVHIPSICEQKKIQYTYVPSKLELGKAIGMSVTCSSIAVVNQGTAGQIIKEVLARTTGTSAAATQQKDKPSEKSEKPATASAGSAKDKKE